MLAYLCGLKDPLGEVREGMVIMAAQNAEASSTSIEFILLNITEWDS